MTTYEYLLLAHLLLDYSLQGDFLARGKRDSLFLLAVHAGMWSLGCLAVLDHFALIKWWTLPWLFFGHALMDWVKVHRLSNWLCMCGSDPLCEALQHKRNGKVPWETDPLGLPLLIDQAFHLLQLWACL